MWQKQRGDCSAQLAVLSLPSQTHVSHCRLDVFMQMSLQELKPAAIWQRSINKHRLLLLCLQLNKWPHRPPGRQSWSLGGRQESVLYRLLSLTVPRLCTPQRVTARIPPPAFPGHPHCSPGQPAQDLPLPSTSTLVPECSFYLQILVHLELHSYLKSPTEATAFGIV